MRTVLLLILTTLAAALPLHRAEAQPPTEWALHQNEPNPFCGVTVIEFAAPVRAQIDLRVWNPDGSEVIRTLISGVLLAGFYSVEWDQRDEDGNLVPSGDYPYQLLAVDPDSGGLLFNASLTATVECDPTPHEDRSWGSIKHRYSRKE